MKTFRALAALLSYPTLELQQAVQELQHVLKEENLLKKSTLQELDSLFKHLSVFELLDLEEQYVLLFDRTRSLSLHLFEHVHGESRDRGQAMVDLRQQYADAELEICSNELPDYIPLFLEYLSTQKLSVAKEQLSMCAHILEALKERLVKQNSPYAAVFAALTCLANTKPDADQLTELMSNSIDDPNDMAAIDQVWEENAVTFRPMSKNCSPSAYRSDYPVVFKPELKTEIGREK